MGKSAEAGRLAQFVLILRMVVKQIIQYDSQERLCHKRHNLLIMLY